MSVAHLQSRLGKEAMRWIVDWGFMQLGLHRISLSVVASNDRAISLYKTM
jgi:RimJ/RimL family protein N-acetyltransferase